MGGGRGCGVGGEASFVKFSCFFSSDIIFFMDFEGEISVVVFLVWFTLVFFFVCRP